MACIHTHTHQNTLVWPNCCVATTCYYLLYYCCCILLCTGILYTGVWRTMQPARALRRWWGGARRRPRPQQRSPPAHGVLDGAQPVAARWGAPASLPQGRCGLPASRRCAGAAGHRCRQAQRRLRAAALPASSRRVLGWWGGECRQPRPQQRSPKRVATQSSHTQEGLMCTVLVW
jgi:hypothetical protein